MSETVRAHELSDGDVITIKNLTLEKELTVQFEQSSFHEVKFGGYDEFMQTIWVKTGRIFSMEELNEFVSIK
jgi:hypothetical protein